MFRLINIFILNILIFCDIHHLTAQDYLSLKVGFYNVENLFDTEDDPSTMDDEFTPSGSRNWTSYKLYDKTIKIYRVITGIGQWDPPAVMGLCEVENSLVLSKLIKETPLERFDYDFIHYESPDRRGIDVAMLYRPCYFRVLFTANIRINDPQDTSFLTRDILYVKGRLAGTDTVHFFINHWPSRYGNYQQSVGRRMLLSKTLRSKIDSLLLNTSNPQIIIMGDFNDTPDDESIKNLLSNPGTLTRNGIQLKNLVCGDEANGATGTIKYRHQWQIFDLIIISDNMLSKRCRINVKSKNAHIYWKDFLLEHDERYLGKKPFRTYIGPKYNGGYSDHLPVYMEVGVRK